MEYYYGRARKKYYLELHRGAGSMPLQTGMKEKGWNAD
jgi:hypothetical protein